MDRLLSMDSAWAWLCVAAALSIAEMIVPGVYLIWLALAALLTGLAALVMPIDLAFQALLFAIAAVFSIAIARRFGLASRKANPEADRINDRAAQIIGRTAVVTEVIGPGRGRVKLGDSEWIAEGCSAQVGDAVVVAEVRTSVLVVQKLANQPADGS